MSKSDVSKSRKSKSGKSKTGKTKSGKPKSRKSKSGKSKSGNTSSQHLGSRRLCSSGKHSKEIVLIGGGSGSSSGGGGSGSGGRYWVGVWRRRRRIHISFPRSVLLADKKSVLLVLELLTYTLWTSCQLVTNWQLLTQPGRSVADDILMMALICQTFLNISYPLSNFWFQMLKQGENSEFHKLLQIYFDWCDEQLTLPLVLLKQGGKPT